MVKSHCVFLSEQAFKGHIFYGQRLKHEQSVSTYFIFRDLLNSGWGEGKIMGHLGWPTPFLHYFHDVCPPPLIGQGDQAPPSLTADWPRGRPNMWPHWLAERGRATWKASILFFLGGGVSPLANPFQNCRDSHFCGVHENCSLLVSVKNAKSWIG